MKKYPEPLDLSQLKVFPLKERKSMSRVEDILIDPDVSPALPFPQPEELDACVDQVLHARAKNAAVMLIYGAHLVKNGGASLIKKLIEHKVVTHLATNGAGAIHDWEFAFQGWSTESVEQNVATGTFGTWDETGRNVHLAVLVGGWREEGFGQALGRFIHDDGVTLPTPFHLEKVLSAAPGDPLSPARAELLIAMRQHGLKEGENRIAHPWKETSIFFQAFKHSVPLTVHPGIGYDIISNHPMFNGAALGRAADIDFRLFGAAVENLDDGVVFSVGSAIMGPQVFEKSISCVNNLRLQRKRQIVHGHHIYVVDLQDGGRWDWSQGEPPKHNPAYYLRFCKSFSRMGGTMRYLQCDNVLFLHHLWRSLKDRLPNHDQSVSSDKAGDSR